MKFLIATLLSATFALTTTAQITTYPYFTGFEGTVGTLHQDYPTGWTNEDLNTNAFNASWEIIKNSAFATNAHTDSSAVHIFSNAGEDNNDWLFTPGFQMQQGMAYTITFWYSASSLSTAEAMDIYVGRNASSADMLPVPIWENDNITTTDYIEGSATFQAINDDVFYFGFHAYSEPLNFILYVDDVTVTESAGTGLGELTAVNALEVAPNPCVDEVRLMGLDAAADAMVNVYSTSGQLLEVARLNAGEVSLSTEALEAGVYLFQVQQQGVEPRWSRVVVAR